MSPTPAIRRARYIDVYRCIYLYISIHVCIYIYLYIYVCVYICILVYSRKGRVYVAIYMNVSFCRILVYRTVARRWTRAPAGRAPLVKCASVCHFNVASLGTGRSRGARGAPRLAARLLLKCARALHSFQCRILVYRAARRSTHVPAGRAPLIKCARVWAWHSFQCRILVCRCRGYCSLSVCMCVTC